jgi:hypothetical protein
MRNRQAAHVDPKAAPAEGQVTAASAGDAEMKSPKTDMIAWRYVMRIARSVQWRSAFGKLNAPTASSTGP